MSTEKPAYTVVEVVEYQVLEILDDRVLVMDSFESESAADAYREECERGE